MRDAAGQVENRERAEEDGSICASLEREKRGRLRRVDGTERERARLMRAKTWAAWGRMSRMRVDVSEWYGKRAKGEMEENG